MCGIGAALAAMSCPIKGLPAALIKTLTSRGPDIQSTHSVTLVHGDTSEQAKVDLAATVLHLRGEVAQPQPLVDEEGNVLLWNGEVFAGFYLAQMLQPRVSLRGKCKIRMPMSHLFVVCCSY